LSSWTVHYEIPLTSGVYEAHVLSESAEKAKAHVEAMIPDCNVITVD